MINSNLILNNSIFEDNQAASFAGAVELTCSLVKSQGNYDINNVFQI